MDDDSFDSYYDLCVNGTGLIESIVSCAASRAGLKVLHVDKNDYYGKHYSSHSYDSWMQLTSCISQSDFNKIIGSSFKNTTCRENNIATVSPTCENVTTLNKTFNEENNHVDSTLNAYSSVERSNIQNIAVSKSRYFNIDLTTKLLLCSSSSVELIIKAGISDYLEFKSIEAMYYINNVKPNTLLNVPCSKNEVFNSKLLTAFEKRILTKFLQFANDYGRETSTGESAKTLNENELSSGRSLHRPQNKNFNSSGYNLENFESKPFSLFLKSASIPDTIQDIIIHALCLRMRNTINNNGNENIEIINESCRSVSNTLITKDALLQLYIFLNSFGKFSDTSLLTPIYGTSEIVQAFCRMCAVWGGVYILGRSISQIHSYINEDDAADDEKNDCVNETNISDNGDISNTIFQCSEESNTNLKPSEIKSNLKPRLFLHDSNGNKFSCHSLLTCIEDYPCNLLSDTFKIDSLLLTRVSIINKSIMPMSKCLLTIPPNYSNLNNKHAIFITQLDSSAMVCYEGFYQLNIVTLIDIDENSEVYYKNESLNANIETINSNNNTTTNNNHVNSHNNSISWSNYTNEISLNLNLFLDKVIHSIRCLKYTDESMSTDTDREDFLEVDYINFIRPLFEFDMTTASIKHKHVHDDSDTLFPSEAVYICSESTHDYTICLDNCMDQARIIFEKIFPGKEFMCSPLNLNETSDDNSNTNSNKFSSDIEEIEYYKLLLKQSNSSNNDDDVIYVKMINRTDI